MRTKSGEGKENIINVKIIINQTLYLGDEAFYGIKKWAESL